MKAFLAFLWALWQAHCASSPPSTPALDPPSAEAHAAIAEIRRGIARDNDALLRKPEEYRGLVLEEAFAQLEGELGDLQERYEFGDVAETTVETAFRSFATSDPQLREPLERWVAREPNAWIAHAVRGMYLTQVGFDARGTKWASKTSETQFAQMRAAFDEAVPALERATELRPRFLSGYGALIQIAKTRGGDESGKFWMDRAIESDPLAYHPRAQYMYALTPRWGGSYEEMRLVAREARKHAEHNPLLYGLGGDEYADRAQRSWSDKDHAAAAELYSRALAFGPRASWYRKRARLLAYLERHEDAVRDLSEALSFEPRSAEALRRRARSYRELENYPAALADLEQLIALHPNDFRAFEERAMVHEHAGRLDQAIADLRSATELDPELASAWNRLGWIYFTHSSDYDASKAAYRQYAELRPNNAQAWLNLASALERAHDPEMWNAARRYLQVVDRDDPKQAQTIRRVEALLAREASSDSPPASPGPR